MLARILIPSFVRTGNFEQLYASFYGDGNVHNIADEGRTPPTWGHMENLKKTLLEWAERLREDKIDIHQEGAIARFLGAQKAPGFGRHPGAVAARAKTVQFFEKVLRASVAQRGARTFNIPAAATQGYFLAVHEAKKAAQDYRKAAGAIRSFGDTSDRPELQAEADNLGRQAGRARSMHTTAMAEAVGCGLLADRGPWFRSIREASEIPTGVLCVGVEVTGNSEDILSILPANLDTQHGGGTFGLGSQPQNPLAACDAAVELVQSGLVLPESTRFVTNRIDPDSLVAAMILAGRIPRSWLGVQEVCDKIMELAKFDNGDPLPEDTWKPGEVKPQTVSDLPDWAPVNSMCLGLLRGQNTLEEAESAVLSVLSGASVLPEKLKAAVKQYESAVARASGLEFSVDGPVAYATDLPIGPGVFSVGYSEAPIVVMAATKFPLGKGKTGLKYTVGVAREIGPKGPIFMEAFLRKIATVEPGWGGQGTIAGSVRGKASLLCMESVLNAAKEAAVEAGINAGGVPSNNGNNNIFNGLN